MGNSAADKNDGPHPQHLDFNDLTIEDALRRARWALSAGYKGRRPGQGDQPMIPLAWTFYINAAQAHLHLAEILQRERDYEERKIKEIVDGGTGV